MESSNPHISYAITAKRTGKPEQPHSAPRPGKKAPLLAGAALLAALAAGCGAHRETATLWTASRGCPTEAEIKRAVEEKPDFSKHDRTAIAKEVDIIMNMVYRNSGGCQEDAIAALSALHTLLRNPKANLLLMLDPVVQGHFLERKDFSNAELAELFRNLDLLLKTDDFNARQLIELRGAVFHRRDCSMVFMLNLFGPVIENGRNPVPALVSLVKHKDFSMEALNFLHAIFTKADSRDFAALNRHFKSHAFSPKDFGLLALAAGLRPGEAEKIIPQLENLRSMDPRALEAAIGISEASKYVGAEELRALGELVKARGADTWFWATLQEFLGKGDAANWRDISGLKELLASDAFKRKAVSPEASEIIRLIAGAEEALEPYHTFSRICNSRNSTLGQDKILAFVDFAIRRRPSERAGVLLSLSSLLASPGVSDEMLAWLRESPAMRGQHAAKFIRMVAACLSNESVGSKRTDANFIKKLSSIFESVGYRQRKNAEWTLELLMRSAEVLGFKPEMLTQQSADRLYDTVSLVLAAFPDDELPEPRAGISLFSPTAFTTLRSFIYNSALTPGWEEFLRSAARDANSYSGGGEFVFEMLGSAAQNPNFRGLNEKELAKFNALLKEIAGSVEEGELWVRKEHCGPERSYCIPDIHYNGSTSSWDYYPIQNLLANPNADLKVLENYKNGIAKIRAQHGGSPYGHFGDYGWIFSSALVNPNIGRKLADKEFAERFYGWFTNAMGASGNSPLGQVLLREALKNGNLFAELPDMGSVGAVYRATGYFSQEERMGGVGIPECIKELWASERFSMQMLGNALFILDSYPKQKAVEIKEYLFQAMGIILSNNPGLGSNLEYKAFAKELGDLVVEIKANGADSPFPYQELGELFGRKSFKPHMLKSLGERVRNSAQLPAKAIIEFTAMLDSSKATD